MELNWLGNYRKIVGDFYRSANGYSQICKNEHFGDSVKFSPYEVQIMEHILEYAEQNKNMKWYAEQLGLSQATYSKYVQRLVHKGLVEKYHAENNQKSVILRVSPLGMQEYQKYVEIMKELVFSTLIDYLDTLSPDQLEAVRHTFAIWARFHCGFPVVQEDPKAVKLIKIK